MKYIRNRMNYFRQIEGRIEDYKTFGAAVKEQNDSEPIPTAEPHNRISFVLMSVFVVIILLIIIVLGIRIINSMDNPDQIFEDEVVLYCFFGVFCTVGLLFSVIPIVNGCRLKLKCTEEYEAICIGYDDVAVTNKHGVFFKSCPVYKFTASGTEYTVYDQKYTRDINKLPAIGSVATILFAPENPNQCIINNKVNWKILSIIVGVIFLFLAFVFYFGVLSGL